MDDSNDSGRAAMPFFQLIFIWSRIVFVARPFEHRF